MSKLFIIYLCVVWSPFSKAQEVTYHQDIKSILCNHCTKCHQANSAGPMPLTSYEDVASFGAMIEYVVRDNIMPPWKASHDFSELEEKNYLNKGELETISAWVKGGVKEGEQDEFECVDDDIVSLESVDLKFSMSQNFQHKGDFKKSSQVFVIPNDSDEDLYVDGIEFIPGNKRIIRSCNISIDTSQRAIELDNKTPSYGYANNGGVGFMPSEYIWHHWSPGQGAEIIKEGIKKIPSNSSILMHIIYAPSDEYTQDSSSLHISLTENPEGRKIISSKILIDETTIVNGKTLAVRSHDRQLVLAEMKTEKDIILLSVMPQGQYACKSWRIIAIDSIGGLIENIIEIKDWDINWQRKYFFTHPIFLKSGSIIRAIADINNTKNNFNLPMLPPKKIVAGESTRAEMFRVQFDYYINDLKI